MADASFAIACTLGPDGCHAPFPIQSATSPQEPVWIDLDRSVDTRRWLSETASLDEVVVESLLTHNSRPRLDVSDDGILLILRGGNFNEGERRENLISVRIWMQPNRIITVHRERVRSIDAIRDRADQSHGPTSIGALLIDLVRGLTTRLAPLIDDLSESLDHLEDGVIDPHQAVDRFELIGVRQRVITLHRFIVPQLKALTELGTLQTTLLDDADRDALDEIVNEVTRYVEDLEAARSRASLIQDELANVLGERLSRRTYAVTIIAAIVLPMTLISGMLGMNVGGVPWTSHPHGFAIVSVLLVVIGVGGWALARLLRWL